MEGKGASPVNTYDSININSLRYHILHYLKPTCNKYEIFANRCKDIIKDIDESTIKAIWEDTNNGTYTLDLINKGIYREFKEDIKRIQEGHPDFYAYKIFWNQKKPSCIFFHLQGKDIYDGFMVRQFYDQRYWEFPIKTKSGSIMDVIVYDTVKNETWFYKVKLLAQKKIEREEIDFTDPTILVDYCKVEEETPLFDAVVYVSKRYESDEGDILRFKYEIISNTFKKYENIGTLDDLVKDLKNKGMLYEGFNNKHKQALLESIKQQLKYTSHSYEFYKKIGIYAKGPKLIVVYPTKDVEIIPSSKASTELLQKVKINLKTLQDLNIDVEDAIRILNKRIRYSTINHAKISTILSYAIGVAFANIVKSSIIPHLVLCGSKGTGKTTTAELFVNLYGFGIIEEGTLTKSEATKHKLALSNCLPMLTDEVGNIDKLTALLKEIATATIDEHSHMRLTKEGEVREKFNITCPVVFTTNFPEHFRDDSALIKRVIFISFDNEKTDPTFREKLGDAIKPLPIGYLILEEIARKYIPEELEEIYKNIKRELLQKNELEDPRDYDTFTLVLLGKKLLTRLGIKLASEKDIIEVLKESTEVTAYSNDDRIKDIILEYCKEHYESLADHKEEYYVLSNKDLENILSEYRYLLASIKGNKYLGNVSDVLKRTGLSIKFSKNPTEVKLLNETYKKGKLLFIPIPKEHKEHLTKIDLKEKDELLEKVRELIKENSTIEIEELKAKLGTTRDLFDDIIQTLIGYGEIRIDGNKIRRCPT